MARRRVNRWLAGATALLGVLAPVGLATAPAHAAPLLTIEPITWNVIGLDSNDVTGSGPDTFPVGARICNTGDAPATGVASQFAFDTANPYLALDGPSALTFGDLAAASCTDAYFNVVVARTDDAFDTTRGYHITASANGISSVSTPTPRELVVEHLISQNRNSVLSVASSAIDAPGHATVVVGRTYTFTVTGKTATGGYEQLEAYSTFPGSMFQVLDVDATYDQPAGATNDRAYADACGWDNVISSGTYLECVGPEQYAGGKAGGNPIVVTYTVKATGPGSGSLQSLIYDFSGSSFHYNSDFSSTSAIAFDVVTAPDVALDVSHTGTFTAGSPASYSIDVTNVGGAATDAPVTVTTTLPAGLTYSSAAGTGWSCGAAGQDVTCTRDSALASGAASAITLNVGVAPSAPASISLTATASLTGDGNAANDADTDVATVDRLPIAGDDSATTAEDTAVDLSVLTNDTGGDGTLSVTGHGTAAHGSVACTASVCTYTPDAHWNGTDTFTYTVEDADGDPDTGLVTVTVTPVNDAPVADGDTGSTPEDTPLTVAGPGVLADDTDVDGDTLTAALGDGTDHGTLVLNADGSYTYTPDANWSGTDTFTYQACDATVCSAPVTVTITVTAVDDAPVAGDDDATTAEDTAVDVSVLTNDAGAEGPLSVSGHSDPAHGSVTCTAAACTYTPDADWHGTDTFTYTVEDADGDPDTGLVTVTVTPVNDAPIASPDTGTTAEDVPLTAPAPGVLATDNDVDGDTLAAVLVDGPDHGTLVLDADGSYTYTPDANWSGTDTFTYQACDTIVCSAPTTVTLTVTPVNDAPVASDDSGTTPEDTPLTVAGPGVLADDNDVDGDTLTADLVTGPSHGTLVLDPDGGYTYTPDANWHGTDTFTYQACDAVLCSTPVTVTLTVTSVDDAPVAGDDATATAEDTPVDVDDLLDNDTSGDGALAVTGHGSAAHGTVTCTASACTYTPDAGWNGTDTFTYTVEDPDGDPDTAVVTVTVDAVDDTPVAGVDTATTAEDTPVDVSVLGNDTGGDGALSVSGHGSATHGTVNCTTSACTYTPDADWHGTDTFTYTVEDADGDPDTATVTVTVTPVNDAPAGVVDGGATIQDVPYSSPAPGVLGDDTDADGDPLTAALVDGPDHGTLVLNSDGSYTYTPTPGWSGVDSFTYEACDGTLCSPPTTVTLTVVAAGTPLPEDPPGDDPVDTTEEKVTPAAGGAVGDILTGEVPGTPAISTSAGPGGVPTQVPAPSGSPAPILPVTGGTSALLGAGLVLVAGLLTRRMR